MTTQKIIPIADVVLGEAEKINVNNCLETEWISSLGTYIPQFEAQFSKLCGAKYGVAVSNGTVALHLALHVLGIGAGDEVIIPSLTFIATANAVTYSGAKVVFAEVSPDTGNIDPLSIQKVITKKTKAIIPVHLYGHPADMGPIIELARQYNLSVIEDAAEAHGAKYLGSCVGSIGDIGTFSFYGNKIITTGEGGMLITNNMEIYNRALFFRDHAMSTEKRYWHPEVGFNYRMTNIQAAIGVGQLQRIEEILEHKRTIAKIYNDLFADMEELILPVQRPNCESVFWMYSPRLSSKSKMDRNLLIQKLRENGIDSRPFFYPIHTMPPYLRDDIHLPITEQIAATGINLPSGLRLTFDQQVYIKSVISNLVIQ